MSFQTYITVKTKEDILTDETKQDPSDQWIHQLGNKLNSAISSSTEENTLKNKGA